MLLIWKKQIVLHVNLSMLFGKYEMFLSANIEHQQLTILIYVYWKLLILTPFLLHLMTWHVQGHAWHTSLNQYSSSFNRDQPCPKINISRSIPIIGNTVILCIYIPIRYVETTKILIEHLPCFVFRNAAIIVDVQPGEGNLCHHHFFFRQQVN